VQHTGVVQTDQLRVSGDHDGTGEKVRCQRLVLVTSSTSETRNSCEMDTVRHVLGSDFVC